MCGGLAKLSFIAICNLSAHALVPVWCLCHFGVGDDGAHSESAADCRTAYAAPPAVAPLVHRGGPRDARGRTTLVFALVGLPHVFRGPLVRLVMREDATGRAPALNDPAFDTAFELVTGARLTAGNRVEVLSNGGTYTPISVPAPAYNPIGSTTEMTRTSLPCGNGWRTSASTAA